MPRPVHEASHRHEHLQWQAEEEALTPTAKQDRDWQSRQRLAEPRTARVPVKQSEEPAERRDGIRDRHGLGRAERQHGRELQKRSIGSTTVNRALTAQAQAQFSRPEVSISGDRLSTELRQSIAHESSAQHEVSRDQHDAAQATTVTEPPKISSGQQQPSFRAATAGLSESKEQHRYAQLSWPETRTSQGSAPKHRFNAATPHPSPTGYS